MCQTRVTSCSQLLGKQFCGLALSRILTRSRWREVTQRDSFWEDFKSKVLQGTLNRRMAVSVNIDLKKSLQTAQATPRKRPTPEQPAHAEVSDETRTTRDVAADELAGKDDVGPDEPGLNKSPKEEGSLPLLQASRYHHLSIDCSHIDEPSPADNVPAREVTPFHNPRNVVTPAATHRPMQDLGPETPASFLMAENSNVNSRVTRKSDLASFQAQLPRKRIRIEENSLIPPASAVNRSVVKVTHNGTEHIVYEDRLGNAAGADGTGVYLADIAGQTVVVPARDVQWLRGEEGGAALGQARRATMFAGGSKKVKREMDVKFEDQDDVVIKIDLDD